MRCNTEPVPKDTLLARFDLRLGFTLKYQKMLILGENQFNGSPPFNCDTAIPNKLPPPK